MFGTHNDSFTRGHGNQKVKCWMPNQLCRAASDRNLRCKRRLFGCYKELLGYEFLHWLINFCLNSLKFSGLIKSLIILRKEGETSVASKISCWHCFNS